MADKNFIEKVDLNHNGVPDVQEPWLWLWLLKTVGKAVMFFANPEKHPQAYAIAAYIVNTAVPAIEDKKG